MNQMINELRNLIKILQNGETPIAKLNTPKQGSVDMQWLQQVGIADVRKVQSFAGPQLPETPLYGARHLKHHE